MADQPDLQAVDVMSAPVFSISPETLVDGIEKIMREQSIGALPVTDSDGHPLGIVTRADLLRNLAGGETACERTAGEVMSRPPQCIAKDTATRAIAALFDSHRISHAMVLSEGRLVGMVSASDLSRHAPAPRIDSLRRKSDTQIREAIAEKLMAVESGPESMPEFSVCDGVVRFWGEPPTAEEIEAVVRAARSVKN